jgi:Fic family protein
MDVTPWMEWFLGYLGRAIEGAQHTLAAVLTKARFWQGIAEVTLNDRQRLVLNRLLDGFEGQSSPRARRTPPCEGFWPILVRFGWSELE